MHPTTPLFKLPKSEVPEANSVESPARPEGASLVRIYPAGVSGSLIALDRPMVRFGRGQTCEHEMADEFASREHCVIQFRNGHHVIRDLGSMNGTFVNDQMIEERVLKPGDQIRVGFHIFKYLSANDVEAMYHEAVFQMMTVDALTQTYNRRYFEDAFQREVLRSSRHGRSLGLLLMDIDHFKDVNDKHGHLVGDQLLAGMCRRMKVRVRGDEILARIGGEEFALVAVEVTERQLREIGDSIRELVASKPFDTSKGPVSLTVSIGASHVSGRNLSSPRELMDEADKRLYDAKSAGRNCVRY
ncbi:MAG: GGDEF domain-containing protein [Planctomycetaceae bacterium]|nr:GGDEF domain-containing protein [Planctomycetaceae bacterium]MCB9953032.1 GGDEF domain-containing protein [Planctomycetaceae bacterium]